MKELPFPGMPTFVVETRAEAERAVAAEIVALLRARPGAVLGLASGETTIGLYRELCDAHRAEALSFAGATAFQLDEYLDLAPDHPARFRTWMQERLFRHVDLRRENARLPEASRTVDPLAAALAYEDSIRRSGGIDLQILGLGRNGHIGFNEPGSPRDSRTRVVELHATTRADAARVFGDIERVPRRAITMGVATILDARRLRVLAFGAGKADVVRRTLRDPVSSACPSTYLRGHREVKLFVDREAAGRLEDRGVDA